MEKEVEVFLQVIPAVSWLRPTGSVERSLLDETTDTTREKRQAKNGAFRSTGPLKRSHIAKEVQRLTPWWIGVSPVRPLGLDHTVRILYPDRRHLPRRLAFNHVLRMRNCMVLVVKSFQCRFFFKMNGPPAVIRRYPNCLCHK
jgi:hypothetical protein